MAVSAAFVALLDVVFVIALVLEGPSRSLAVSAVVLLGMSALCVPVLATAFQRATLTADTLKLGLPLLQRSIRLADIQGVRLENALVVRTVHGNVRLRTGLRRTGLRVMQALSRRLPPEATDIARNLPFVYLPRTEVWVTNVLMTLLFGPGALAIAAGVSTVGIREAMRGNYFEALTTAGIVLFIGLLGALISGLFLFSFQWKVVFAANTVRVYYPLRWKTFAIADLQDIDVAGEIRTYKRVKRQAWWLALRFTGDREVRIEPTENGIAARQDAAADLQEVNQLRADLRRLYARDTPRTPEAPVPPSDLLAAVAALSEAEVGDQYENLRDQLAALRDPKRILLAARAPCAPHLTDLFATVLADAAYADAMPWMVELLDHTDPQVRFVAAMALDALAQGKFGIETKIVGGWVQHDAIAAEIPAIRAWWTKEGASAAADLARKQERSPAPPPASDHDKRCNFLALNPNWAILSTGEYLPPDAHNGNIPIQGTQHLVGGWIHEAGGQTKVFAVFAMDTRAEDALGAWVKGKSQWIHRQRGRDEWRPNRRFY